MKITAIAREDLSGIEGLEYFPNSIVFELKEGARVFPDSYGDYLGIYNKKTQKYESAFIRDQIAGNTETFDKYRLYGNHIKKKETAYYTEGEIIPVIKFYEMYDIKESSKNKPTETKAHVDKSYCVNGYHKCKYELLFACDGMTLRIVVEYQTNNIPMYEFIGNLEDEIEDALNEADEDNLFYGIIKDSKILMFDEFGHDEDIEIESAEDLISMLVSVRLISCEFIEKKENKQC